MAAALLEQGSHALSVALVHPQIAPNTGNIARLCVATGTRLHLVRPMGFVLSDRNLKRAAMDYWNRLNLTVHDDMNAFEQSVRERRIWLFENQSGKSLWEVSFSPTDVLIFGSETTGLPRALLERSASQIVSIPQVEGERCLNLSTSVGIALYEAIRQLRPTLQT